MIGKVEENRLRRVARRRGYAIAKSRRRDRLATDYGRWTVTRSADNRIVLETGTLEDVRRFLEREES